MKSKDIVAIAGLAVFVCLFTLPLLSPGGGALDLYPKNQPRAGNYHDSALTLDAVFEHRQIPLWAPGYEGGIALLAHPGNEALNLLATALLGILKDEPLANNMTWVVCYLLGACSMYYLCRSVLGFNVGGAFLSSVVFSMNAFFPYWQEMGFSAARMTLLLPLLVALLLKAKADRRFIVYASLVLGLITIEGALFVPSIVLFLFFWGFFDLFQYRGQGVRLAGRFLNCLITVCAGAFLLVAIKILPMFLSFGTQVRPPGVIYEGYISNPNSMELLFARLLLPIKLFPPYYIGVVPVVLCILASLVYFKRMKVFVIGLILAVWLSFGPNASLDLNKFLWHLPFFHEMKEIPKYYGVWIIFFVSILSGSFLVYLDRFRFKAMTRVIGALIIMFVSLNLIWSNIGYFNSFNMKLGGPVKAQEGGLFNMEILNGHPGDESIAPTVAYFLEKKNIGLISLHSKFQELTSVSPKFFLLPRYAFLSPYTSFLVLPNPFYRGEVYFLDQGSRLKVVRSSAGSLILDINTTGPDRLVFNQNYDIGWRADYGKIERYNNLLSVRFDKAISRRINVWYFPGSFIIGAIISGLALIAGLAYLIRGKNGYR